MVECAVGEEGEEGNERRDEGEVHLQPLSLRACGLKAGPWTLRRHVEA